MTKDKPWQKTEITYLKRHAEKKSHEELAERFNTDVETVRAKLEELGLAGIQRLGSADDPAIETYEKGLKLLAEGEHAKAAEALESVIEEADTRPLKDRARQHLEICRRVLDGVPDDDLDPYTAAVMAKNEGELEKAMELAGDAGDAKKDADVAYLVASIHALAEREDEALAALETAISLDARKRVHAFHDPDFEALRDADELRNLLAVAS